MLSYAPLCNISCPRPHMADWHEESRLTWHITNLPTKFGPIRAQLLETSLSQTHVRPADTSPLYTVDWHETFITSKLAHYQFTHQI